MREKDETMVDENDKEMKDALENDEYKNYFNNEYTPQILITTSISHTFSFLSFLSYRPDQNSPASGSIFLTIRFAATMVMQPTTDCRKAAAEERFTLLCSSRAL